MHPLFKNNTSPLFIISANTFEIMNANESACNQYKWEEEELTEKVYLELFPKPDLEIIFENGNPSIQKLDAIYMTNHRDKEGEVFPIYHFSTDINYKDREGRLIKVIPIDSDDMPLKNISEYNDLSVFS